MLKLCCLIQSTHHDHVSEGCTICIVSEPLMVPLHLLDLKLSENPAVMTIAANKEIGTQIYAAEILVNHTQ